MHISLNETKNCITNTTHNEIMKKQKQKQTKQVYTVLFSKGRQNLQKNKHKKKKTKYKCKVKNVKAFYLLTGGRRL